MKRDLITIETTTALAEAMTRAGRAADDAAAANVFLDYTSRRAKNTIKRQAGDLALFAEFLRGVGISVDAACLATDPATWSGVSWGLVEAFIKWQLNQGYAVTSINVRLSTVKTFSRLAMKAGTLDPAAYALIKAVAGYGHAEASRVDETRTKTRKSRKKATPVAFGTDQAAALRSQPDTPQGRRDRVIIALLLDLGLRVDELARLTVDAINVAAGTVRVYRPKTDTMQTHEIKNGTLAAVRRYLENDAPPIGPLLRSSRKGGELCDAGMSKRAIQKRVGELGARVGLAQLSPHDLRHYWATRAARNGTPLDRLKQAGGWSSPAMPLRYVQATEIANAGVRLDDEPAGTGTE